MVGLAIMAVMMTVAMPVWKQMAQREKEEELVFRGEQIAHSIGMFQRKFANAYPPSLDVLVEQKFLRKKYKDPVTNDDFALLTQAQGQAAGQPNAGRGQTPGRGQPPGVGAAVPGTPVGGIIGVTSKSSDTSIRLYKGRSHYNEWAFVYTPPPNAGGAAGQGGAGRGNTGQGSGQNPQGNGPFPPGSGPFPPGGQRGNGRGGQGGQGGRGGPPGGATPFPVPFGPGRGR